MATCRVSGRVRYANNLHRYLGAGWQTTYHFLGMYRSTFTPSVLIMVPRLLRAQVGQAATELRKERAGVRAKVCAAAAALRLRARSAAPRRQW